MGMFDKLYENTIGEVVKRVEDVTEGRRLSAYETYTDNKTAAKINEVVELQKDLAAVGAYSGKVDGRLSNPKTTDRSQDTTFALVDWANANGHAISISSDGEVRVPDATRNALAAAAGRGFEPRQHDEVIGDDATRGGEAIKQGVEQKMEDVVPQSLPDAAKKAGQAIKRGRQ